MSTGGSVNEMPARGQSTVCSALMMAPRVLVLPRFVNPGGLNGSPDMLRSGVLPSKGQSLIRWQGYCFGLL